MNDPCIQVRSRRGRWALISMLRGVTLAWADQPWPGVPVSLLNRRRRA